MEEGLECGHDWVYAAEYDHDGALTHLGEDIQVEYDALLGRISQAYSHNCVHDN